MTSGRQWLLGLVLVVGAVTAAGIALVRQIPPSDELASRTAAALQTAAGVQVNIKAVNWHLLPSPSLVIEGISTLQAQPVVIEKITLYPSFVALWQRRLKMDRAEVTGAVVPQVSTRGLAAGKPELASGGLMDAEGKWVVDEIPLNALVFRNVTWVSRTAIAVQYEGEVDFAAGWRPIQARVRLPAAKVTTELVLVRKGQEDIWAVTASLGGGSANGELQLDTKPNGRLHLSGQLKPQNVEVASAVEAFNRRPLLSGKASGTTQLQANGDNAAELAQSLHTQTRFAIGPSTLLRFDLDKAVRSIGRDHQGQTPLDSVNGQLDTQNTASGMAIEFTQLKATSGALSASGKVKLLNRTVDAELAVDLVDGLVGIPLKITGPMDKVASVPPGAVAGAAVGTVVLPGVGTAIGARLGAAIGNIFSPARAASAPKAPAQTSR